MVNAYLPDFVIIGATKAATTWLSQNLRAHPDVFMPSPELHYFSRLLDRGEDWYRAQFAGARDGQLIGEKSASYLPHPDAPRLLHHLLPQAKLLAQLRNPVERAYSDYCMHYRRGEVNRDIDRYLDARRTPIPRLLEDGFYYRHLTNFLRTFARGRLKILLYDDIRERPREVFREVCGYLGIDALEPQAVEQRVKDKETPRVPPRARRLLAPLKAMVQPYRGTRAFVAAHALIARRLRYPPLAPELRQRLQAYYAEDVARLGDLLGRDLSAWLSEAASGDAASRSTAAEPQVRRPALAEAANAEA